MSEILPTSNFDLCCTVKQSFDASKQIEPSFNSASRTLRGIDAMHMIRKGPVKGISQGDSVSQAKFISESFGVRA